MASILSPAIFSGRSRMDFLDVMTAAAIERLEAQLVDDQHRRRHGPHLVPCLGWGMLGP